MSWIKKLGLAGIGILAVIAAYFKAKADRAIKLALERKLEREKQANKVNEAVIQATIDADKRETEIDEKYKVNTDRFDIK